MSDLNELRQELQGVLAELLLQLGGYGQVTEARDALMAEYGMPSILGPSTGVVTANPHGELETWAMPLVPDDGDMGRVYVQPFNPLAVNAPRWMKTQDAITGLPIMMRAAACGAGCRCATEVRIDGVAVLS